LSGDLSPLAGLKSLQALTLSLCKQMSGGLRPLGGLKSLKTLNLSLCHQFPLDGNKELHEQLDQTMFNINTNPN
jgi:hypothetical protein